MSNIHLVIQQRDEKEARIKQIINQLESKSLGGGVDAPLIDQDGYPRSDLDLYQVRSLRNELACLRTDVEHLDEQLYIALQTSLPPSSEAITNDTIPIDEEEESFHDPPLFKIGTVEPGSPAAACGLQDEDIVLKFGSLSYSSYLSYSSVVASVRDIVSNRVDKTIDVKVKRNNRILDLVLRPTKWEGGGFLGCQIKTI
ncbi:hypothetical protein P9112_002749 [Eukaryota sp. TZLM1-RC]